MFPVDGTYYFIYVDAFEVLDKLEHGEDCYAEVDGRYFEIGIQVFGPGMPKSKSCTELPVRLEGHNYVEAKLCHDQDAAAQEWSRITG